MTNYYLPLTALMFNPIFPGIREVLVDADGIVTADLVRTPTLMDNHLGRPEIIEASQYDKGLRTQYRATLDEEMHYCEMPLDQYLTLQWKKNLKIR